MKTATVTTAALSTFNSNTLEEIIENSPETLKVFGSVKEAVSRINYLNDISKNRREYVGQQVFTYKGKAYVLYTFLEKGKEVTKLNNVKPWSSLTNNLFNVGFYAPADGELCINAPGFRITREEALRRTANFNSRQQDVSPENRVYYFATNDEI